MDLEIPRKQEFPEAAVKHLCEGLEACLVSPQGLVPIILCYSPNYFQGGDGSIYWLSAYDHACGEYQSMPLDKLTETIGGKSHSSQAEFFSECEEFSRTKLDEYCCFSLVSPKLTLHLVAKTYDQRQRWVLSLHAVIQSFKSVSPGIEHNRHPQCKDNVLLDLSGLSAAIDFFFRNLLGMSWVEQGEKLEEFAKAMLPDRNFKRLFRCMVQRGEGGSRQWQKWILPLLFRGQATKEKTEGKDTRASTLQAQNQAQKNVFGISFQLVAHMVSSALLENLPRNASSRTQAPPGQSPRSPLRCSPRGGPAIFQTEPAIPAKVQKVLGSPPGPSLILKMRHFKDESLHVKKAEKVRAFVRSTLLQFQVIPGQVRCATQTHIHKLHSFVSACVIQVLLSLLPSD